MISLNRVLPLICFCFFSSLMMCVIFIFSSSKEAGWLLYGGLGSALLVSNDYLQYNIKPLFTIFLCSVVLVLLISITNNAIYTSCLLFVVSFGVTYFISYRQKYLLAMIFLLTLCIVAIYQSPSLPLSLERSAHLIAGGVVIILMYYIFLPNSLMRELPIMVSNACSQLKDLSEQMFVCFLAEDYIDNNYLYERRLHLRKNNYLHAITVLKGNVIRIKDLKVKEYYQSIVSKIDNIFNSLEECAQLRYRVKDHATFALCKAELISLSHALTKEFETMMIGLDKKNELGEADIFMLAINSLEENYQHVLKSSAQEPLVFLLFISSLKVIENEFQGIRGLLPLVA